MLVFRPLSEFHFLAPALDVTIERTLQFIKGGYSHAAGQPISRREIWQRGFTDHRIRDADDFTGHRIYIHQNPLTAKLSTSRRSQTNVILSED